MEKINARKLPPAALEHIRRQAFVLRTQGCTWAHIAEVIGVHVDTVSKWGRRAQADSVDTVIKGGQRGRRHGSTSMIPAITKQGLVRSSFFEGDIDAERFIVFLRDLIQDAQRKVFLVIYNLRAHHANRVHKWVAESTEKIELFYLPPYAPELNPDEYLNRDLKTTIRSGSIAKTAAALLEKARACMEHVAAMPDRMRSYFGHEYVRYAQ